MKELFNIINAIFWFAVAAFGVGDTLGVGIGFFAFILLCTLGVMNMKLSAIMSKK